MPASKLCTPLLDKSIEQRPNTQDGEARRMGIEIEFAGVESSDIVSAIQGLLGGDVDWQSPFDIDINNTQLGNFKVELDSNSIKKVGQDSNIKGDLADAKPSMEKSYIETVSSVASALVPWEVVSPPIQFANLEKLFPLVEQLREAGAKGTRDQLHYAFGVHLNPELNDLQANTIVNYLKSFFCVYEWIKHTEKTDAARRITPYINHFSADYVKLVLDAEYAPSMPQLIDDYLEHNATRNRSLDMLPLFSHIDGEKVKQAVHDDRVKARPTFHYRLANCDIDNPQWNLNNSIETWMLVEHLAYHSALQEICDAYLVELDRLIPISGSAWSKKVATMLEQQLDGFSQPG